MNRLTDQQRRMVEENLSLVTFCMNEYIQYVRRDEWDDVFQEGAIGLCRAAALYRPEQGVKFSTFAVPCIVNAIYAYLRKKTSKNMRFYMEALRLEGFSGMEHSEKLLIGGTLYSKHNVEREFACIDLMDFIRNELGTRDTDIVFMLLDGKRQNDIAERFGISQPSVSRIISRINQRINLHRFGVAS